MKKKFLQDTTQLPIIIGLLILGLIVSFTVNLAQKKQRLESKAAAAKLTTPAQTQQD